MSFLTVADIKRKITPKLHGASLAKVGAAGAIYDKMHEAASNMLLRIDPPSTIQRQRIDNAIFDKVYNYTAPTDMKGQDKVVDMRPISPRGTDDDINESFIKEFDVKKTVNTMTVETIGGVKTLRISKKLASPTLLEAFDVNDSTIVLGGDASNASIDDLNYISGGGAYSFDLSGVTGIATITVSLPSSFDLSKLLNRGSLFAWVNFPDASRLTSVDLKWGSSAAAYWHKTITVPQGRTAFDSAAWNLDRFDWSSATKVGSPDSTAISYLQVTLNYSIGAALTAVLLDSITAALGSAYELLYYSENLFKDASTGALKQVPTADTDIIMLDQAALNIYIKEFLAICYQELKGRNMGPDIQRLTYELEGDGRIIRGTLVANRQGLYRDYQYQNPSQAIPLQTEYYSFGELDGHGLGGNGEDDMN